MPNIVRHTQTTDTNRGPSPALWSGLNLEEYRDFARGWIFEDDFMGDHDLTNRYTATQANSEGTWAIIDEEGGVADADSASTTDGGGINVQAASTVGERFLPQADDLIVFEARVKLTDTSATTGADIFVGLSEIDTTIIASSANTSANHIGFEVVTEDNVLLFHSESAGTRSSTTTPGTLVDGTYIKLGFRVKGTTEILVYVNGNKFAEKITSNIPVLEMVPSFVCQSSDTVDPILSVDWVRCVQHQGS